MCLVALPCAIWFVLCLVVLLYTRCPSVVSWFCQIHAFQLRAFWFLLYTHCSAVCLSCFCHTSTSRLRLSSSFRTILELSWKSICLSSWFTLCRPNAGSFTNITEHGVEEPELWCVLAMSKNDNGALESNRLPCWHYLPYSSSRLDWHRPVAGWQITSLSLTASVTLLATVILIIHHLNVSHNVS